MKKELPGNFDQNDGLRVVSMNAGEGGMNENTSKSPIKHSKEEFKCRKVSTGEYEAHDSDI